MTTASPFLASSPAALKVAQIQGREYFGLIRFFPVPKRSCFHSPGRSCSAVRAAATSPTESSGALYRGSDTSMKLLFVEMGVGYDQHGQDVTVAAMRACRDAISSNSIPAFRRGSIPGVTFEQMKLHIKLGVPQSLQQALDTDRVKSVFP